MSPALFHYTSINSGGTVPQRQWQNRDAPRATGNVSASEQKQDGGGGMGGHDKIC
jgi:hypothetical protein